MKTEIEAGKFKGKSLEIIRAPKYQLGSVLIGEKTAYLEVVAGGELIQTGTYFHERDNEWHPIRELKGGAIVETIEGDWSGFTRLYDLIEDGWGIWRTSTGEFRVRVCLK